MFRTRVKICGVCRAEDAVVASRAGADAIGMIRVSSSPRYVEMEEAREIAAALPPFVSPVMVYGPVTAEQIKADLTAIGRAAIVQLNGGLSISLLKELAGVSVMQAIRADERAIAELDQLRGESLPQLTAIVLETPGQLGGSGVSNDWAAVRRLIDLKAFEGLPPLIAAGGLSAENVEAAIRLIRPYAVDISSGVELSKREKSVEKVVAFIAAVRLAEREAPLRPV